MTNINGKLLSLQEVENLEKKNWKSVEESVLTKVKIKSNSRTKTIYLLGEIPNEYKGKNIYVNGSREEIPEGTVITQQIYSKEYGLLVRMRTFPEAYPRTLFFDWEL